MKRHLITLLGISVLILVLLSCNRESSQGDEADSEIVNLELWSISDELNPAIAKYEESNPNVKINLTVIPNENYPLKLLPVLRSGKGAPDIFVGEAAYVRRWTKTPFWLNLSAAFPDELDTDKLAPYTVGIGQDSDSNVRALSWQATPGGSFIRRSYAREYFGTDDPEILGEEIFGSQESILAAARSIKEQSNGEVFMFASASDLFQPFKGQRKNPYVVDGKLVIDPAMLTLFELAKTMYDEDLIAKTSQWTPAWFNGMKKDGKIFSYLLPTWGLHFVLKANAPDSSGDWLLTKFIKPWFWGGTWLGIYAKSEHPEAAWGFVKAMTQDNDFMTWWAKETGDFISNQEAVQTFKDEIKEDYLAGQNHYEYFASQAEGIVANFTEYEQEIDAAFQNALGEYLGDRVASIEEALDFFRKEVKTAYPDIVVE